MHLIRDISSSSAFWGAAWVFGCFPDVHIVGDMPIGCFAMMSLAVTNYADALPHLENLTPTVIREEDVINGTSEALKRTIENLHEMGVLEGKRLVVLSSAESEMIGADHTGYLATLDPDARFLWGHSLEQDEWEGRDRALVFAWREYGAPYASNHTPTPLRVNIIGPTLSCFNAPSDLHELKRLITAIGGEINMVYPYESSIADTPRLANAAVNVVMYHEFGEALAKELNRPYLFAPFGMKGTTQFLYELGALIGAPKEQVEAFIKQEKQTTLKPIQDIWYGTQSDWFSTIDCCIVGGRSYVKGLHDFLNGELGIQVVWMSGHPLESGEPDNNEIRKRLHERAPVFVFGSINERIYLAEAGSKSNFIPSSFPGPIMRRALGTPFMGYSGAVYVTQEIVNRLYDIVFHVLPVETISRPPAHAPSGPPAAKPPTPTAQVPKAASGIMLWNDEATERLNVVVGQMPYLGRFSASRTIRQEVEKLASERGVQEVNLDIIEEVLAQRE